MGSHKYKLIDGFTYAPNYYIYCYILGWISPEFKNSTMFTRCRKAGMAKYDAEKISMNLLFLAENTVNTKLLIHKLIDKRIVDEEDQKRILLLPTYDHTMEVYLTVIRKGKGPHAFSELLDCLNASGNDMVLERLNPQTDFQVISMSFRRHWPFTCLLIVSNICGSLYWLYRLQNYYLSVNSSSSSDSSCY